MKSIILSIRAWKRIREELHKEYPKTVFMIRDKMKRTLGFTVREHTRWTENPNPTEYEWDRGYSNLEIHLDFYSENKRTMFLLKFGELINIEDNK